jgi:hypothetical protein
MVPLSNLVSVSMGVEPNSLTQFNQRNSATFQAIPMPGVTMGDAVAFLTRQAASLPAGFSYDWQSDARQYSHEGSALMVTFVFAIIVIYLVLAAQYESLRDPLIILISVPMSICGALIPLALGAATINIYTQIGLVTLIGLISKHGILMVEFANEMQLSHGLDRRAAMEQAARVRLRRAAESAAAASQASEADLAQIRVVVAAEVARNYFEMRGAEQRLRVARDSLASQRDTLRIVQALADSGRGNESDVASARAELATVEASLPVQETARRLAAYRLAVLAGLRPAELGGQGSVRGGQYQGQHRPGQRGRFP